MLTDEQQEWLKRWFPVVENSRIAQAMGISIASVHRFTRQWGLTKSEKGMRAIRKRQAAKTKKKCEESGYYDSIRGRTPHINSIVATKRMWQDVRDGKREHPLKVLKKKHPKRYRMLRQRQSDARKLAIKMERARMLYGLPRKTRIRQVVMTPYTRSQNNRRYNASKRGYILADTCAEGSGHRFVIYYDNTTPRSPRFERNCMKDGFRFKEWES